MEIREREGTYIFVELYNSNGWDEEQLVTGSKELKPSHHAQPKAFALYEIIPCNEGLAFKSD